MPKLNLTYKNKYIYKKQKLTNKLKQFQVDNIKKLLHNH